MFKHDLKSRGSETIQKNICSSEANLNIILGVVYLFDIVYFDVLGVHVFDIVFSSFWVVVCSHCVFFTLWGSTCSTLICFSVFKGLQASGGTSFLFLMKFHVECRQKSCLGTHFGPEL